MRGRLVPSERDPSERDPGDWSGTAEEEGPRGAGLSGSSTCWSVETWVEAWGVSVSTMVILLGGVIGVTWCYHRC